MRLPDRLASRAVLIGTAHYGADSGFTSFDSIEQSIRRFADFLCHTTGLQHVSTVLDPADGGRFGTELSTAAAEATDLLLFYFVGHGVAVDNELHLTHSGSRLDDAEFTTVPYPAIRRRMKAARARVKIVILDCCHSGKAFGPDVLGTDVLMDAVDIDGTFVLTATDEKRKFAIAADPAGRTAFTGALLDIFATGLPTADRYLTMSALFHELRDRLPAANLPKPKALERGTAAKLALAHNVAWRREALAPLLPTAEATAYLAQVRDIAPAALVDRDYELAELSAFCNGEETYLWWRGGPWTGKTALMSWFALHPPEHVRVVSFFITSRLAAQADHAAFTDAVLEQLSALLPSEYAAIPATVGNRDALRRRLLDLAAQRAAAVGDHVVLIVDGLDEDQGAPSIASLLPMNPGPGLRVIVASRPNPPIPLDVRALHPLHTCRRRELAPSEWARDLQRDAQLELHRLLNASDDIRHVLGLVTAAGGLTGSELSDLTGLPPYRVDKLLGGVTGRTFRTRLSPYMTEQINLLAHETLQQAAEDALGRKLLDDYRHEIHTWAQRYRSMGWPEDTPTYLLTRYFAMLKATDDLPRMIELTVNSARHDRMLQLTGGDYHARNEIGAVQDRLLEQDDPDLFTMCQLAVLRKRLESRSDNIPVGLPAVFALLGEHDRALSLARSIPDPHRRAAAHIGLVECGAAIAPTGGELDPNDIDDLRLRVLAERRLRDNDPARVRRRVDRLRVIAESLIRDIVDTLHRDALLTDLSIALLAADNVANAERLIAGIRLPGNRIRALTGLVPILVRQHRNDDALRSLEEAVQLTGALQEGVVRDTSLALIAPAFVLLGRVQQADRLVHGIGDPRQRLGGLAHSAAALQETGSPDTARRFAEEAHTLINTAISSPFAQTEAKIAIIAALTAANHRAEAVQLAEQAERTILAFQEAYVGSQMLGELVGALVASEQLEWAERLVLRITDDVTRAEALTRIATGLAGAGARAAAVRLADQVVSFTHTLVHPQDDPDALKNLAHALVIAGDLMHAGTIADRIPHPDLRARTLSMLAEAVQQTEQAAAAPEFAARAEAAAQTIPSPRYRAEVLANVIGTLARIGLPGRATDLAARIVTVAADLTDHNDRDEMLARVIKALIEIGKYDQARAAANKIVYAPMRVSAFTDLAAALVTADRSDYARELLAGLEPTARIAQRGGYPAALVQLVVTLLQVGAIDRALALADQVTDNVERASAYSAVVAALAVSGEIDQALELLPRISERNEEALAWAAVVAALAESGEIDRALELLPRVTEPAEQVSAYSAIVKALAESGDIDQALALTNRNAQHLDRGLMHDLVAAVALAGDPADARALVRGIEEPYLQIISLAAIVQALATQREVAGDQCDARDTHLDEHNVPADQQDVRVDQHGAHAVPPDTSVERGLLDDAAARLNEVTDPDLFETATLTLISAALRIADTSRAEALIRRIDEPNARIDPLLLLADALLDSYHPTADTFPDQRAARQAHIHHVLAEVWSIAPWYRPLHVIARLDSGLLSRIAVEVSDMDGK